MKQQASQAKFTMLTTFLQVGMAVLFGIMVRSVSIQSNEFTVKAYWQI